MNHFTIEAFLWWMEERHQIYLKRAIGLPGPWTDDRILQKYRFTNVYRELDRTTVWFRENFRHDWRHKPEVILGTIIFRWFNRIETGERLIGDRINAGGYGRGRNLFWKWHGPTAEKRLRPHPPWTTGAYIIHSPNGRDGEHIDKLSGLIDYIDRVWKMRRSLELWFNRQQRSMEEAVDQLQRFEGIGGFMAYEIACDLAYTRWLEKATDLDTWANPGPGARRGLNRIFYRPLQERLPEEALVGEMRTLLELARERWAELGWGPELHLREIEHSLCEFDKYLRAKNGEGRPRGVFNKEVSL